MKTLQKILVASDSNENIEDALAKAAYLEHYSGCEIEVFRVLWDGNEDGERAALASAVSTFSGRVASIRSELIWHRYPDQAILEKADRMGADLIIVPAKRHHIRDFLMAPLEWHLIRHASCPVLVAKGNKWRGDSTILAALDTRDPKHQLLNKALLESGLAMADLLDANLHLVSVFPDLDFNFTLGQGPSAGLHKLICDVGHPVTPHLVEGKAQKVIPRLAKELNPAVALIGTHARSGMGKWILGNTAETVMPQLQSDILVVRV